MKREKFDDSIKCLTTISDIHSLNSDTLVLWQFAYINRNLSAEDELGETGALLTKKFVPTNCTF